MSSKPIKKVIVVGGSGRTGQPIVKALLEANFEVSILSRASSTSTGPQGAKVIRTDYIHDKLVEAFKGQDAVVVAIDTFSVGEQKPLIDAALAAGVRRYVPSEFGVDTSRRETAEKVPATLNKFETAQYLKTLESKGMSWTATLVGGFFDPNFKVPGVYGWDLSKKTMTVFDDGNLEFEVTTISQIARTVVAILSRPDETANQYVYVHSFTLSQNKILQAFEKHGQKFTTTNANREEMARTAGEKAHGSAFHEPESVQGQLQLIALIMMNQWGVNEFSKKGQLWNERLGLPKEDLDEVVKGILSE